MAEEKKKKQPPLFKDFGRNLQRAGRNFGNGLRALVGVEEKPPIDSDQKSNLNRNSETRQRIFKNPKEVQDAGDQKLDQLQHDWDKKYEAMLVKYRNKFSKENEQQNKRLSIRLKRIERRNKDINGFLEKQRKQWQNNQLNRRNRRIQRRKNRTEQAQINYERSQQRWDRFMNRSQKATERLITGISRTGWRLQFQLIMILIPLIIVALIIYFVLKPILL